MGVAPFSRGPGPCRYGSVRNLRGTEPGRRRGVPLWRYLTALVLLPLVGVVVLAAAAAQARADEAAGAERADRAMRSLALLDAARSGAEQELIPVLSLSVIGDPGLAASLGIPENLIQMQRSTAIEEAARARQRTDDALSRIRPGSIGGAAAQRAAADLAELRTVSVGGDLDIDDVYLRFLAISTDLMTAQEAAAAAATSEGVPDATMRAIRDVQAIARLTQIASRQMPLYLGSMFVAISDSIIGSSTAWRTSWLDYPTPRGRWTSSRRPPCAPPGRRSARPTWWPASTPCSPTGSWAPAPPRPRWGTSCVAVRQPGAQRAARRAGDDGARRGAGPRVRRPRARRPRAAGRPPPRRGHPRRLPGRRGLPRRSVARALRLLAGQATQISEGSLVEVEVSGPREVRTVSAALRSAVAGLRRIQDQAQAVARGDLDSRLLHQPLPGPLGRSCTPRSARSHLVRQREELQFALAHQATHDALTELPNRAQAVTLVEPPCTAAQRTGARPACSSSTSTASRRSTTATATPAGDEVLRVVSQRAAAVRAGDVVCRLGGDEFVVLWSPCTASTTCSTWPPA